MSALGSKADICSANWHVRFTPESGHVRRNWSLWANTGIDARSGSLGCDAVAYLYAWRDLDQSIILRSLYSSMRSALPLNLAIASFSIHLRAIFLLGKMRLLAWAAVWSDDDCQPRSQLVRRRRYLGAVHDEFILADVYANARKICARQSDAVA